MTSKRRSLINLLSLSYLSKSISKCLLIKISQLSYPFSVIGLSETKI